ncbi:hypothetical protein IHE45_03G045200 [Dioscorea alata]|uniref:Uncharacterized protein n=1 Tax=Dioscorea alata TaxID=55571 RepID=A0ACB7WKW9_DIOAL|nr:hypothetical protein IHE45_03G045200 [Dioscorea alata]
MISGRKDGPLMKSTSTPLSRGSRIAIAVAVGVLLGCICAFLYPDGLFREATSRIKSSQVIFLLFNS